MHTLSVAIFIHSSKLARSGITRFMGVTAVPATLGMSSCSCDGVCGLFRLPPSERRLLAGVAEARIELRWASWRAWRRLAFSCRSSLRGTLHAISGAYLLFYDILTLRASSAASQQCCTLLRGPFLRVCRRKSWSGLFVNTLAVAVAFGGGQPHHAASGSHFSITPHRCTATAPPQQTDACQRQASPSADQVPRFDDGCLSPRRTHPSLRSLSWALEILTAID
jgi:hypothetical protein